MAGSRPRDIAALTLFASLVLAASQGASASGRSAGPASGNAEAIVLHGVSRSTTSGRARSMRLAVPPETQAGDLLLATVTARLSSRGRISPQGGWRRVRETSNVGGPALTQ